MIDLSDVAAIRAIAQAGSLSRAAAALHMSQPTLSKRLARLEDRLGATVFLRGGKGAELTDVGRFLLAQSDGLSTEMERVARQARLLAQGGAGRLRLGVGPIVEELFLPAVALDFIDRFPDATLEIRSARASSLLTWLQSGELDAVVGPFDGSEPLEDVLVTPLVERPVVFVARPAHPLASATAPISAEELARHRLASPDAPDSISRQTGRAAGAGVLAEARVQCPRYATLRALAREADMVVAGPAALFVEDFAEGRLRALPVALPLAAPLTWRSAFLSRRAAADIAPLAAARAAFENAAAALAEG